MLVQSGVESAVRAARRALANAPPLAIAMARAARGGEAVVEESVAADALGSIGGEDARSFEGDGDEEKRRAGG